MTRKQIYFIAGGFQGLDLFGPLDAFMETNDIIHQAYESKILSLNEGAVLSSHGQQILADHGLADQQSIELDDLIICGGTGMRQLRLTQQQLMQLRALAGRAERVMSICTGAFVLAKLYPNRALTLTTHWRHSQSLQQQAPAATINSEPLFLRHDNIWSSAGVLSGVDLALAIIRQDYGNTIAAQVAKELVIYLQRSGSQKQYSDALQLQSEESMMLSPLLDWLSNRLHQAVSVVEMAEYIGLSERQLTRLFKQHLNATPSAYFKSIRLNYARDLLSRENVNLQTVAAKVGFDCYDSFRRAFFNQFGILPSSYLM